MEVEVVNKKDSDNEEHFVKISTTKRIEDYSLLQDILRYVLPAGYYIKFVYQPPDNLSSKIEYQDVVRLVSADKILAGGVRLSESNDMPEVIDDVNTSIIVNQQDLPDLSKRDPYGAYKKIGREDLWGLSN